MTKCARRGRFKIERTKRDCVLCYGEWENRRVCLCVDRSFPIPWVKSKCGWWVVGFLRKIPLLRRASSRRLSATNEIPFYQDQASSSVCCKVKGCELFLICSHLFDNQFNLCGTWFCFHPLQLSSHFMYQIRIEKVNTSPSRRCFIPSRLDRFHTNLDLDTTTSIFEAPSSTTQRAKSNINLDIRLIDRLEPGDRLGLLDSERERIWCVLVSLSRGCEYGGGRRALTL
jgi:hypothetical protein